MVVLSKLFNDGLRHLKCCEITHQGTCRSLAVLHFYRFLISNARYFGPITLLPLVLKLRELNWKIALNALHYFRDATLTGWLIGWLVTVLICVFRQLLGEYRFYSFLFIPAFVGALPGLFAPSRTANLFAISIIECMLESIIMRRKFVLTKTIAKYKLLQTWLFMGCSAIILQAKRYDLHQGFWFLTAPRRKLYSQSMEENNSTSTCKHHPKENCSSHLMKGVRTYFIISLTLDIIKTLMEPVRSTNVNGFMSKIFAKFANFNGQSTLFFVCYLAIYRVTHCVLNRKSPHTEEWNHTSAGFLAGICYIFFPRLSLLTYSMILAAQGIANAIRSQKYQTIENNKILKIIRDLPYTKMIYPFGVGYLVHTYCLRPQYISRLGADIVNGLTDNYGRQLKVNISALEKAMEANLIRYT